MLCAKTAGCHFVVASTPTEGEFLNVKYTDAFEYDLTAVIINE